MQNRRTRRARARRAYDMLSKQWRMTRRNQDSLVKIGMLDPGQGVVGRKPPISVFMTMTAEMDPFDVVNRHIRDKGGNSAAMVVHDVLEYAREHELTWEGRDARLVTRRGVETIPMAGDDD